MTRRYEVFKYGCDKAKAIMPLRNFYHRSKMFSTIRRFFTLVPFCLALFFLSGPTSAREETPALQVQVAFSSSESGQTPEESFFCSGRVYAHVTFSSRFSGKQSFEALWIKPDGTIQERTPLTVDFPSHGGEMAHLWINFDQKKSTVFDDFSFGGDYGIRKNEFNGPWIFQIFSDGILLTQSSFEIVCG